MNTARLPSTHLTQRRAFTLLAQRARISQLLAALAEAFPERRSGVHWELDPGQEVLFARPPSLSTAIGDELGFRYDGTVAQLITQAMQ